MYLLGELKQLKERKELTLTDNKNISTYRFEPIQRLQPHFITDDIKNFMAQQKQRKQPILTDARIFFLRNRFIRNLELGILKEPQI